MVKMAATEADTPLEGRFVLEPGGYTASVAIAIASADPPGSGQVRARVD